jgi:hypothetical protein
VRAVLILDDSMFLLVVKFAILTAAYQVQQMLFESEDAWKILVVCLW